ncbi:HNH endonuclease [Mycolicibacterium chubuense]|uniref:HNH endonuclease n=1 Tax=Mycolicibacterium chubuense TaxID=1800 RepID=UPI000D6C9FAA
MDGGLLLRRDLHRLFDQGLIAVTQGGTIDVADSLQPQGLYFTLHGQQLQVTASPRQREWLALHWNDWR